jgi:hypothetical protein
MLRKIFVGYLFLTLVVVGCKTIARSQATPTPTKTPKPTFTATSAVTPTAVVMATATSLPTDTPAPAATDTPAPAATDTPAPAATDTPVPADTPAPTAPPPPTNTPEPTAPPAPPPTPTPDKDYKLVKRQLMCGHGGHVILITVVDINGAPLDGIVLKVTDPDPNTPTDWLTTGDKGPGKAEALMWGEHWVHISVDASGNNVGDNRADIAEHVDRVPPTWDLIAAGECDGLSDEECEQRRHTCDGSYELVFQRQW